MGDFRTSARAQANIVDKEAKALQGWLSGMTYDEVAAHAGYSGKGAAVTAVKRAVTRRQTERDELADQAGTIMLDRLDMLFRAHIATAIDTNSPDRYKATDRILGIMDRIAKLQGLNAPLQVEATVRVKDELDDEIATLVRKLKDAGPADALPDTPVLDSIIDAQVIDDQGSDT